MSENIYTMLLKMKSADYKIAVFTVNSAKWATGKIYKVTTDLLLLGTAKSWTHAIPIEQICIVEVVDVPGHNA